MRQGRISSAQQLALATLMPAYGIEFADHALDFDRAFGRRAPRVLEIGFGMGETTAAIARMRPGDDFLAIEVHSPGVGALLRRIRALGLTNVRIVQHDAVELVAAMIPEELQKIRELLGSAYGEGRYDDAGRILSELVASDTFEEFLTLPAYDLIA